MISINLGDPNVVENFKALNELRHTGLFSDEELQELYDKQVEADREMRAENDDEAISHAMEVAEKNECKMTSDDGYTDVSMKQCATDHRQLAEWLTELKQWRRVYGVCPSYEMCIPECKEGYNAQIAEYKRLLKAAVEDFKTLVLKSTALCNMKIACNKCPLNCTNDNLGWKKEAEALKLIGETNDEP